MTWQARGSVRSVPPADDQPMIFDDLVFLLEQRWPGKLAKITVEGPLVYVHDLRGRRKLVACTQGVSLPYPHSNVYDMRANQFTHFPPWHNPGWYTGEMLDG